MVTVNENALRSFYFTPIESLVGLTVGFYVTPEAGGTTIQLGSKAGTAAGVEMFIACDFSLATEGTTYHYEVIADKNSTNPVTILPDERSGAPLRLRIRDIEAIS